MHMTAPRRRLPPRAEHIRLRGRSTDLERPEEWERQDLEPGVLFCLFLHSNELLIRIHTATETPAGNLRRRSSRVRDGYSSRIARLIANLRQPNYGSYCAL